MLLTGYARKIIKKYELLLWHNRPVAEENGECIMQTNVFVVYTLKHKTLTGLNQICISMSAIGRRSVTWLQTPPFCSRCRKRPGDILSSATGGAVPKTRPDNTVGLRHRLNRTVHHSSSQEFTASGHLQCSNQICGRTQLRSFTLLSNEND